MPSTPRQPHQEGAPDVTPQQNATHAWARLRPYDPNRDAEADVVGTLHVVREDPWEIAIRSIAEELDRKDLDRMLARTAEPPMSDEERAEAERQRAEAEAASLERTDTELRDLYRPRGGRPRGSRGLKAQKKENAARERYQTVSTRPDATYEEKLESIEFDGYRKITRGRNKGQSVKKRVFKPTRAKELLSKFREEEEGGGGAAKRACEEPPLQGAPTAVHTKKRRSARSTKGQ
jgi:hypothetical protein